MSKGGKFGTMGGVFTPSILTILGVIMYMRLGWVAGNSDTLFVALLIVFLAHIVSVTTGLSVSSVATDKKIRGGGIYYMLSRSLGFPIGGAIGITLFLATALSISLYLIGFSESLLAVGKGWFGIEEITINHLRIAGTVALFSIVTVAYISTSVAIKTQYIILGLIGLSLVSIFFGTSAGKGFDYTPVTISGLETVGFATLFGVFFPAVTGFTAGVAMSGDLKNPQKSIPWGTMLAIGTGLIIYICLTIFVYVQIPTAELRNNTNVLVEFGWIPQFVIAGIWGATLSSALGGILGGPRILQAMSVDKITPLFFAKGVGKDNEPRRALILIFLLAEIGVLIGELDVIASIVTMFYMAAYLFINVSCFLEQWASPDFRPTFRVPLVVSLLGAIVTFLLMIQLDIVSALLSVVVMSIIFLWLTRKQLELGSGDVWQSVWSSIVKLGLKKLNKKETHQRNWEPNILLFSGGTNERPHLLELSKAIAGRNGMISNFDLIENKSAQTLFPKNKQAVKVEGDDDGSIFFRRQECRHIYEGIESIAQTYGFSGVEPNTVLLGWGHHTTQASQFTHMTNTLHKLDYNILFFDYDKIRGFGKKQKIDIWWRDLSQVSYFTVQLSKFLLASKDWGRSEVRFIYLNNDNSAQYVIKKAMMRITQELKNYISIEIVNNEVEQKSFYDVVKDFSVAADLIILDLPGLTADNQENFITETNSLLENLGTTLIVKASSHFDKGKIVDLEIEKLYDTDEVKVDGDFSKMNDNLPQLLRSGFVDLQNEVAGLDVKMLKINYLFVKALYARIESIYNVLADKVTAYEKLDAELFRVVDDVIVDIEQNRLDGVMQLIDKKLKQYLTISKHLVQELPSGMKRIYSLEELQIEAQDSVKVKKVKQALLKKANKRKKLKPLYVAQHLYKSQYISGIDNVLKTIGASIYEINTEIKQWLLECEGVDEQNMQKYIRSFADLVDKNMKQVRYKTYYAFGVIERDFLNQLLLKTDKLLFVQYSADDEQNQEIKERISLHEYSQIWKTNSIYLFHQLKVNFNLFRIKNTLLPKLETFDTLFPNTYIYPLLKIVQTLREESTEMSVGALEQISGTLSELGLSAKYQKELQRIAYLKETLLEYLPQNLEFINLSDLQNYPTEQEDIVPENLNVKRVVKYLLDNEVFYEVDNLLRITVNEVRIEQFKIENILKILEQKDNRFDEAQLKIELENLLPIEERLTELGARFSHQLQYINSHCSEILTDDFIWTQANHLNGVIRKEQHNKGITAYTTALKEMPEKLFVKLESNITKGKDLLLKTKYQQRYKTVENPHAVWRDFVSGVTLSSEQKKEIPFYYQQLFVGKQKAPDIPLQNRAYEWERFRIAYARFQENTSGAILFTGEPLSGRSYLLENILNVQNFENVCIIEPPTVLYTDTKRIFEQALKNATMKNKSPEAIFREMPQGTVVVLEDLELWWNRSEQGAVVIDLLVGLIKKYSDKVLFLLTCNVYFYTHIQKTSYLPQCVQETILLQPFSTDMLTEVLLERHNTSGMAMEEEKNKHNKLHLNLVQKTLGKKIVATAGGNIGVAFHLWLSSIVKVENNKLIFEHITSLKQLPDVEMPMWDNMLLQMLLHSRLAEKSFDKIYEKEARVLVEDNLQSLLRTHVIQPIDKNRVFEINPFLVVFVMKYLRKKKFIN